MIVIHLKHTEAVELYGFALQEVTEKIDASGPHRFARFYNESGDLITVVEKNAVSAMMETIGRAQ